MFALDKLFAESWNLAYRNKPEGCILNDLKTPFIVSKNPLRYWLADPFLIRKDQKTYVFAEMYDYIKGRGVIGCSEITPKGLTKWRVVISEKWHLSYPFVFTHNGNYYLMPEMNDHGEIWIYKAIDFPYKWEKKTVLLSSVRYVDTTFFPINQGYGALSQDKVEKTHAFIVNDKFEFVNYIDCFGAIDKRSRPGGNGFCKGGHQYVVCQDCTYTYGGALIFYDANINDEGITFGQIVQHIDPNSIRINKKMSIDGIHTYNATKDFEIIDLKTRRFSFINLFGRFFHHIMTFRG